MSAPVIVFDGVCNVCSVWVQFVLRRDREGRFRFAGMQGAAGRRLLQDDGLDPDDPDSFLLVEEGAVYRETDAIIRILKALKQPWPLAGAAFGLLPRGMRDWAYFRLARNRYRLFGRKETCMTPPAGWQERFLD